MTLHIPANTFIDCANIFQKRSQINLLCIGLDESGKTTILKAMRGKDVNRQSTPTAGVALETFRRGAVSYQIFDVSGVSNFRNNWARFDNVQSVVVVIDRTDFNRLSIIKDQMNRISLLKRVPVCILCNKMDLDGMTLSDCERALGLKQSAIKYNLL